MGDGVDPPRRPCRQGPEESRARRARAEVLSRFPGAVAMQVPIGGGERRWVVVAEAEWPWRFAVGGGETELAAWANALECSGGDGDGDVDVDPTHHAA